MTGILAPNPDLYLFEPPEIQQVQVNYAEDKTLADFEINFGITYSQIVSQEKQPEESQAFQEKTKEPAPLPPIERHLRSHGIDVSEHQGVIDWDQVKASGIEFAVIRASEGVGFEDRYFQRNWAEAKRVGIIRSAYHFFRPNYPIDQQINTFLNAVGKLEPGDLPPVLDIEAPSIWSSTPLNRRISLTLEWLDAVESTLGVRPMLYMSPSFYEGTLGSSPALSNYPLWIAHWKNGGDPYVPAQFNDWRIWQYTSKGSVPGIYGNVDRNFFNGNRNNILALALPEEATEPVIVASKGPSDDAIGRFENGQREQSDFSTTISGSQEQLPEFAISFNSL